MIFRFKQFSLEQSASEMKVGTDGVLLGALAGKNDQKFQRILDIGSGTGLVGLMLAQRFPKAQVHMVELDKPAFNESQQNILNSPFVDRCTVFNSDYQQFENDGYDLIVSNPPFHIEDYSEFDSRRTLARHADLNLLKNFLSISKSKLLSGGRIVFIIPTKLYGDLDHFCNTIDLWCNHKCAIIPKVGSAPVRYIVTWQSGYCTTTQSEIVIRNDSGFHPEYQEVTSDFYLEF